MSKKRNTTKKQQQKMKRRSRKNDVKKILQSRMVEQLLVQSILQLLRYLLETGK